MQTANTREPHHDIDPMYINRWSPRAFSDKPIEESKLNAVFEAARWAPSASNWQPWHFIVAKTEKVRERFLKFINDSNVEWCQRAPVITLIISKNVRNEEGDPNPFHAFDTGTAWGYLTLEAARQGLITHGMGGFSKQGAREELGIPDDYDIQAVFVMGYYDPDAPLSEHNAKREIPSGRKTLDEIVHEGSFEHK